MPRLETRNFKMAKIISNKALWQNSKQKGYQKVMGYVILKDLLKLSEIWTP